MIIFLIITSVTVCLSYLGIFHLCWINSKGIHYSVLPPALVEPYETWFYAALMKRTWSNDSFHAAEDEPNKHRKNSKPRAFRNPFKDFRKKNHVRKKNDGTNTDEFV